jgi:hypothetical protein
MADITVTAANVAQGANAVLEQGVYGGTIAQGQAVYLDAADNRYKLGDANDSALTAATRGIALTAGVAGQPGVIQKGGRINPGGTVVPGTVYVQSATPGGIAPAADLASGHRVTVLGVGVSASEIEMPQAGPFATAGQVA